MAESIRSYRDLIAWQKAYAIGKSLYVLAGKLPDNERFGLIAAIRRSAVGLASDIAHGYGRGNTQDYIYFLKKARGDIYGLDTQLLFAKDVNYITEGDYDTTKSQLDEAERVLAGLIRSLGG